MRSAYQYRIVWISATGKEVPGKYVWDTRDAAQLCAVLSLDNHRPSHQDFRIDSELAL